MSRDKICKRKYPDRPLRSGYCDWCLSGSSDIPQNTFFDHCRKHGWIRGEVCHSHNLRMKRIDANIAPETWEPWMVEHFNRCPDCRVEERIPVHIERPKLLTRGVRLFDIITIH